MSRRLKYNGSVEESFIPYKFTKGKYKKKFKLDKPYNGTMKKKSGAKI